MEQAEVQDGLSRQSTADCPELSVQYRYWPEFTKVHP